MKTTCHAAGITAAPLSPQEWRALLRAKGWKQKELARRWRPELVSGFKKAQKHTALADVHESIDELLYYRAQFLQMAAPVAAI